jgi:hypothetical protein
VSTKAVGGGTSAVASSTHAACERFRGTDPLVTGVTRTGLAKEVGFADEFGGIPDARWMRAQTFEKLVRNEKFASEVTTTAVGRLALDRPMAVAIANAKVNRDKTAKLLKVAHDRALKDGVATLVHEMEVPFVGFEDDTATGVKPDFAIVAPKVAPASGTWLIVGDAKDYERVRSRIDDERILKGFLQVAIGAESAATWSRLPAGMDVHESGVLAVPRNAFLQPEAIVEDLFDHREEVRLRVEERVREAESGKYETGAKLTEYVGHLRATFDPDACPSCTLFSYCRDELRKSDDPTDVLVEIGVPSGERAGVLSLVDGTDSGSGAIGSTGARVRATITGRVQETGQRRTDPVGQPGTINVCIAKSDSAALGVYGMSVRRVSHDGPGEWTTTVFDDPQGDGTRRGVVKTLGKEILAAMKDQRLASRGDPLPVHVVVPDATTADVLASIADSLAGVELSRLRWARDKEMGRPALTFNGDVATVPKKLSEDERRGVSFLLEEDRARALTLRSPVVDLRGVLARHFVTGGPTSNAGRLDYVVAWVKDGAVGPERHRRVSNEIEAEAHTPGARLTNRTSNLIHRALVGERSGEERPAEPERYRSLVREELAYKQGVMDEAIEALRGIPSSPLRLVLRTVEGDAQAVWRRRLEFHASDLVRFGRTAAYWRNKLVKSIDDDTKCAWQLDALIHPQSAHEAAADAGTRELAVARVVDTNPIVIEIDSRRMVAGDRVVLLHVNGTPCVDGPAVDVTPQAAEFKVNGLSIGPICATERGRRTFEWIPEVAPELRAGDELVLANYTAFGKLKGNRALPVVRPKLDTELAPKATCEPNDFEADPVGHQYCCRSHEDVEAEWSDTLAGRRARGELNPQTWPPIVDSDAFEVVATGAPVGDVDGSPIESAPETITADDLD